MWGRYCKDSGFWMKYILALDQGTTSSRALVVNQEGNILGLGQKEIRQIFPKAGWVEHDPTEIWSSQAAVMMEAIAQAKLTFRDIAAIGITNQKACAANIAGTVPSIKMRSQFGIAIILWVGTFL